MRPVIIPASAEPVRFDVTGLALGIVMVPAALGVIPFVLWLARLNGWC